MNTQTKGTSPEKQALLNEIKFFYACQQLIDLTLGEKMAEIREKLYKLRQEEKKNGRKETHPSSF